MGLVGGPEPTNNKKRGMIMFCAKSKKGTLKMPVCIIGKCKSEIKRKLTQMGFDTRDFEFEEKK